MAQKIIIAPHIDDDVLGCGGIMDKNTHVIYCGMDENHIDGRPSKKERLKEATFFKRRIPKESEILVEDFKKNSAKAIYNKIRSLQDPYPNAFGVCRDGKKIFFKKIYYQK